MTRGPYGEQRQTGPYESLVELLVNTTPCNRRDASMAVYSVLSHFAEPVDVFVKRRHGELKEQGMRNDLIYPTIRKEISQRLFAAPRLTDRQLRRIATG